jgi:hypothetical protein
MKVTFERRPSDDPWRGRQPKYDALVKLGSQGFGLRTKLPSGEAITVLLAGGVTFVNYLPQ